MRRNILTRGLAPALGAGALLLSALAACGDAAAPSTTPDLGAAPAANGIWAGNVVAEPTAGGLRVSNNTTRPIGYAVFATDILPVITWRPCTERTGCPTIIPGERRTISAADIPGIQDGKGSVEFYWWHLVQGRDGRLEPDSIRTIEAKL